MITMRTPSSATPTRHTSTGFTLIELLVVITIIAILAGLSFAGVQGALKSAKKAEVRAMANQIKLGIEAYYAEYGYYPSATASDSTFLTTMTGTNPQNLRGIRFLELPKKFTNSSGIVTPKNFYKNQEQFIIAIDTNFSGSISAPDGTSISQGVAVGVKGTQSGDDTNWIATWK